MKKIALCGRVALLLLAFICMQAQMAQAKIDKWADPKYDFKRIQAVYIADIALDVAHLTDIEEKVLMDSFWKQVNRKQPYTVVSAEMLRNKIPADTNLWDAELPNFVNAYAETVLKEYRLEPYVIPAHTELRTRTIHNHYYDRKGKRHDYVHEEPYTVFIPERLTNRSIIQMRFDAYDAATRNKIFSREEYRVDNDSSDLEGMYGEIVRGCLRDFRKNIK